jgi:hypothetical protein
VPVARGSLAPQAAGARRAGRRVDSSAVQGAAALREWGGRMAQHHCPMVRASAVVVMRWADAIVRSIGRGIGVGVGCGDSRQAEAEQCGRPPSRGGG